MTFVSSPSATGTRAIYLGTFAVLAVVATLSAVIYESAVRDRITQHSTQQLAMLRTASVGMKGEIESLSARLRQLNSLPSIQNLDLPFVGPRVEAAFGDNTNGFVRSIVRIDAGGRVFSWTAEGEPIENGTSRPLDQARWQWMADPANRGRATVITVLNEAQAPMVALSTPVWRTAGSVEVPVPNNEFNGVLAVVVDLHRLVQVYLGPALTELAAYELTAGLATKDLGLRLGPGPTDITQAPQDPHDHDQPQGTSIVDEQEGRQLHAWSTLGVADQTWLVSSSTRYQRVTAEIQRSALAQLALTATLLIAVPTAGWLLARRDRRAQDEQRRLERQLAASQKMEAIGKLAGGVAHDFNNMLTAILGYSTMIYDDAPARSETREYATQVRHAAESAAALTQKLLAFSRRQMLQTDHVDFTQMLEGLILLVRRVIGENITVTTSAEPDLWPILADPVQVEQSIVNLAINARDAMPNGGRLEIAARNAPLPSGARRGDGEVKPGDYVQVTVTDSGIGMDHETRERMFEPFFTTKPQGQGTGLGLSTVYGFVRQGGGHISVRSTPGQGTAIELLLPRAPVRDLPDAPSAMSEPESRGRETVLVAEDEEAVRQLAVVSLERQGYHVLAAGSGDEALKAASAYKGAIHVLLSDVVMPGMKGPELASRLRAIRPAVRVLLMSGYAADVITRDDLAGAAFIPKPFSPAGLSKAVRDVLDVPLPSEAGPKR